MVIKDLLKKKKVFIALGLAVLLIAISFFCFFTLKKHKEAGGLSIDCAYFRRLSSTYDNGSIYLFLKNTSAGLIKINKITFDNVTLPDITLAGLTNEEDLKGLGITPSLLKEDKRVLWYYVYPNPIPPGKIGKVVVKCNIPPSKPVNIGLEDSRGKKCNRVIHPINDLLRLRFTYIGFNKNFNKVYIYLKNSTNKPLEIARVFLDTQDVTKESFKPWEKILPEEKKCIEIKLNKPLTKGEYIAAKIITTDGLFTESLVRVFSFFPITTDAGNSIPDLNLDNDNYLASFSGNSYDKDISRNILYNILDCPTHAHGTWQNAGAKAIARTTACRDNDPYHLTYVGICKAAQESGSFAFAEIVDSVKENPVESSLLGFLNLYGHPTQITAQIVKDASSPCPWFSIVPLVADERIKEFHNRVPTPEEARLMVWYAISRGAKGIFYRLPNWEGQELLKKEVEKINQELQLLRDFLSIAEPISLATCSQPLVESCALQAGYEGIILLLINHDTKSTTKEGPKSFTYTPKSNFEVKVKIPEGMKIGGVNEIVSNRFVPVEYKLKDKELTIPIDKLDITREFLFKVFPAS